MQLLAIYKPQLPLLNVNMLFFSFLFLKMTGLNDAPCRC